MHIFHLPRVHMRQRKLHCGRQVDDRRTRGGGLPFGQHAVAHFQREVRFRGGEMLGRKFKAQAFPPARPFADGYRPCQREIEQFLARFAQHGFAKYGAGWRIYRCTIARFAPSSASNVRRITCSRDMVSTWMVTSSGIRLFSIRQRTNSNSVSLAAGYPTSISLKPMSTSIWKNPELIGHAHGRCQRLVAIAQIGGAENGRLVHIIPLRPAHAPLGRRIKRGRVLLFGHILSPFVC